MKFISLTQPLATLFAIDAKLLDTRSWKTSYRGPVAIHAAKGLAGLPAILAMRGLRPVTNKTAFTQLCESEPYQSVLTEYMRSLPVQNFNAYWEALPFGAIVSVADLSECRHTNGEYGSLPAPWVADLSEQEKAFGDFGSNRYGWFFENRQKLQTPIPCRGAQGLRDLPPDIEVRVREQLNTQ